jgi:hypothetical protein
MAQIPNQKAALQQVARHLAAHLHACAGYDESAGVADETVTPAEARRLDWAVDEVMRRLYGMGGQS